MGTHPIFESDFDCLTEMEVVRAAGFLIFRKCGGQTQFLLLKASYGIKHWSVAKGHVDPGEDELTTAYREAEEETGLTKDNLQLDGKEWTLRYNVKSHIDQIVRPKTTRLWLAEQISGEVSLSEEHTEYQWGDVSLTNQRLEKYKDMQQMVVEAAEYLQSKGL